MKDLLSSSLLELPASHAFIVDHSRAFARPF